MKIVALMPVRNEDWVLGLTLRAALMWADEVIVFNHCSTDRTQEIIEDCIEEYPGRVWHMVERDPVWHECQYRQATLEAGRARDATHLALVDADEIVTGNLIEDARRLYEWIPRREILQLPWLCLARDTRKMYASGTWGRNWVSCGFNDEPEAHWKAPQGYDFHHRHPMGVPEKFYRPISHAQGGLMHLQFLSERRLRAKQALYKCIEVVRWPGREPLEQTNLKYNRAVYESMPEVQRLAEIPAKWWEPYAHLMQHLHIDAEPWQEREVHRYIEQYGRKTFEGLDLFGVA